MQDIYYIIKSDFEKRRMNRPEFSLRSYARFLGVNPTSLSLYLNKKRNFSLSTVRKIFEKISVNGIDANTLLTKPKTQPKTFSHLDLEAISVISDWYYFAILSLAE